MDEREVFIGANNACNASVQQIKDEQWDDTLPDGPEFKAGQVTSMTLRTLVNYLAYDNAWMPDMMAGRSMDDAGKERFDGDLLGEFPKPNFASFVDEANAAVRSLDDLDQMVHFSYGSFPARDALKHVTSFRGLRAYDIAKFIGADTTLPDDVVQGLWDEIHPDIELWRSAGIFAAEVPVPEDAPLQDRLLGMTGRQPRSF